MNRTEYFERLQCGLLRVQIDFERHIVVLWLPEHECVDMSGAISYAESLDPDVIAIQTNAGKRLDTCYVKKGRGAWQAYDGRDVWQALRLGPTYKLTQREARLVSRALLLWQQGEPLRVEHLPKGFEKNPPPHAD